MSMKSFLFMSAGLLGALYVSSVTAQTNQLLSLSIAQEPNSSVSSPTSQDISPEPVSSPISSPAEEANPTLIEEVSPDDSNETEISESEINALYSQLEEALATKRWEEADQITYELMLNISGSQSKEQGAFDSLEWQRFPCDQFKRIDDLWSQASEGKLGFSAQIKVFRDDAQQRADDYYKAIAWKSTDGAWLVSINIQMVKLLTLPILRQDIYLHV
jgi:hypothetical protein